MRRLNFFDRHVVKQEGSDLHPGLQKINVACAAGSSSHLWLGQRSGEILRLDRCLKLSTPLKAFDCELIALCSAQDGHRLVVLGSDAASGAASSSAGCSSSSAKYKVFDNPMSGHSELSPQLLLTHRVFPARVLEARVTSLAVSDLKLIAVGTENGTVHLFRGKDLAVEKPWPSILGEEAAKAGSPPITAVHFLEQEAERRTVLFASTALAVCSWSLEEGEREVRKLNVDVSGGAVEHCSCVLPSVSSLVVARGDAMFFYDPSEGNMSAMPMDGEKNILAQFKSYLVLVTADAAPPSQSFFGAALPSSMPKQTVTVCLAYPDTRFIAYQSQFTDVTHIILAMGSIFVLSRGGSDGNTVMFELREKPLSEQLDSLVKKRFFDWAAKVAQRNGASSEERSEIYRQHGDALFEKRAYDHALEVYMKTVDLGLPLEPSYVVERYLDAQRIGHVARYLKQLHIKKMAQPEHTALLLKCYTKLKDFSTLEEFLETTPLTQYDPATAIDVLESAHYYMLAATIAQKVDRHEDYVRISLEHFKSYGKICEFLRSLPCRQACRLLQSQGRVLMRHAPAATMDLMRHLTAEESACVHEFLPVFVEDLQQLELFLRSLLLVPSSPLPPEDAKRLFPTLLELMVRSHQAMTREDTASDEAARLGRDIMRLIRQHPSEESLACTLMLCESYGFVDGLFHAAERLGRFQLLMNWCFQHKDAKRLLEVCKRCASLDQSLWVQALSFLCSDKSGGHLEEIGKVLRHVEESDLMPLFMVIDTLKQSPDITMGFVRPFLQSQFKRLSESVGVAQGKSAQDLQEIQRMQLEILDLRTRAQTFHNARCFQCGLTLEVPAAHFFCGHSYHSYCVPADGGCPKCSAEILPKLALKEQRESQSRNAEDFFKYIQGNGGEKSLHAIAERCKFGPFDARRAQGLEEAD